jgi:putative endonuclease
VVVVVEVKARRSDAYGPAAAAVGLVKQRRLRRLAAEWLASSGVGGVEVRFDVVAITGDQVDVIAGAF